MTALKERVKNMKPLSDKQLGALGEKLAAKHLKKLGYKILTTNYKCKLGEIDIIAREGGEIVFVEVKTRGPEPYVLGRYSVDKRKQEHIFRVATYYISSAGCELQPRFDVIDVELDRSTGRAVKLEHIPNAFTQSGPYSRY